MQRSLLLTAAIGSVLLAVALLPSGQVSAAGGEGGQAAAPLPGSGTAVGSALLSRSALAAESGEAGALRPPSAFDDIADPAARSRALFTEAGKVLTHPRCINCHPSGDTPLQGDSGQAHEPPVVRGRGGLGAVGMECRTCHFRENFDPGAVPGAPGWHLAPPKMAWEGRTLSDLCRQLKDPARNGNRDLDAVAEHMEGDPLVGWGWHPGPGRQNAPGSQEALGALIRAWIDTGAACP